MASTYLKTLTSYTSLVLLLINVSSSSVMASHHSSIKGGYFASWDQTITPSSINTNLFTHIYYAFLTPNNTTFTFNIGPSQAQLLINFTSTLHYNTKTPPVKTLFSVGGAAEGSTLFSRMASNPNSRMSFILSTIEVARKFGFDGIDLDWEFPQTPGDMINLASLLHEWRSEVEKEANATCHPPLLLSAAVYYSADTFLSGPQRSYPISSVSKNLDWINVMAYDYHGAWDPSATGAQAALFDPNSNVSTSFGLDRWIRVGVPRSKLVLGLPLYGRTWELKDVGDCGVGAAAVDVGPGPDRSGVLTYSEILRFNREFKAKVVFDHETVSVYSVSGSWWVGYDDERTVAVKVGYGRALGLRGYFFWAVHGDYKWKISKTASRFWSI